LHMHIVDGQLPICTDHHSHNISKLVGITRQLLTLFSASNTFHCDVVVMSKIVHLWL
jgi:hypothetical protein